MNLTALWQYRRTIQVTMQYSLVRVILWFVIDALGFLQSSCTGIRWVTMVNRLKVEIINHEFHVKLVTERENL